MHYSHIATHWHKQSETPCTWTFLLLSQSRTYPAYISNLPEACSPNKSILRVSPNERIWNLQKHQTPHRMYKKKEHHLSSHNPNTRYQND